ncbi:Hypothetical predicted protein, partial [Marmota monax]
KKKWTSTSPHQATVQHQAELSGTWSNVEGERCSSCIATPAVATEPGSRQVLRQPVGDAQGLKV